MPNLDLPENLTDDERAELNVYYKDYARAIADAQRAWMDALDNGEVRDVADMARAQARQDAALVLERHVEDIKARRKPVGE